MKTIISLNELKQLLEYSEYPMVSVYMPTRRTGNIPQDQIRLKNLLKEARTLLLKSGQRSQNVIQMLNPAMKFLDDLDFWKHQEEGLAIFISSQHVQDYRLPASFPELVVVANRFHIKPLIPLITENMKFLILAISQNQVRLLEATRYFVNEITPDDIPGSLAEALKYDQREKQHQYHTTERSYPPVSHGQGISKDLDKSDILRFFQKVDRSLQNVFHEEQAPLIIAAVDYLHPLYRQANTYSNLIDDAIKGNPELLSDNELREQAWALVSPYVQSKKEKALTNYGEASARRLATSNIKQIALHAYDGRVSSLLFSIGIQKWGIIDLVQRRITLQMKKGPGTQDLIDFASVHTLLKGGMVHGVEPENMPEGKSVLAILRY